MNIIKKETLISFWEAHRNCEQQLKSWYEDIGKSSWKNFNELSEAYSTVRVIGRDRAVFNIKGNNYRLIVKFSFKYQVCYIKFIGTHAEYDKVDALTVDLY